MRPKNENGIRRSTIKKLAEFQHSPNVRGSVATMKLVFIFAALFAVSANAQEQGEHPDSRDSIAVFNGYPHRLTMKLYSQNRRGQEWGPYEIPIYGLGSNPTDITIDCKMDENICMGAWDPSGEMETGLGHGEQKCDNCCIRCDGRGHRWQIFSSGHSVP